MSPLNSIVLYRPTFTFFLDLTQNSLRDTIFSHTFTSPTFISVPLSSIYNSSVMSSLFFRLEVLFPATDLRKGISSASILLLLLTSNSWVVQKSMSYHWYNMSVLLVILCYSFPYTVTIYFLQLCIFKQPWNANSSFSPDVFL